MRCSNPSLLLLTPSHDSPASLHSSRNNPTHTFPPTTQPPQILNSSLVDHFPPNHKPSPSLTNTPNSLNPAFPTTPKLALFSLTTIALTNTLSESHSLGSRHAFSTAIRDSVAKPRDQYCGRNW